MWLRGASPNVLLYNTGSTSCEPVRSWKVAQVRHIAVARWVVGVRPYVIPLPRGMYIYIFTSSIYPLSPDSPSWFGSKKLPELGVAALDIHLIDDFHIAPTYLYVANLTSWDHYGLVISPYYHHTEGPLQKSCLFQQPSMLQAPPTPRYHPIYRLGRGSIPPDSAMHPSEKGTERI